MQIVFPPRVVSLPDDSVRSFFGPDIPMALGNPPPTTGNVSPRANEDEVHFGVSAPKAVKPAGSFIARFTAYVKDAEAEVKERLAKADRKRTKFQPLPESCRWKRGTPVTVRVIGDHFLSTPIEQSFEWNGRAEIRSFQVRARQDAPADWTQLGFEIFVAGLPVACLWLDIEISAEPRSAEEATGTGRLARSAFVSYASDDRPEVLGLLSAMTAHDSGFEVFYDWLDLAHGENWKPRLEKEIIQRDMLYLFWSRNARASKWVNWEWKTALRTKGIHAILPIPIESPEIAKPPKELEQIHFRDRFLVAREAAKHIAERKTAEGNIRGAPGPGKKVKFL
jgi:hypothetical protein